MDSHHSTDTLIHIGTGEYRINNSMAQRPIDERSLSADYGHRRELITQSAIGIAYGGMTNPPTVVDFKN